MKSKRHIVFVNLLLFAIVANLASCGGSSDTTSQPAVIALQSAFPDLPPLGAIVSLQQAPGDDTVWYAVIQDGRVLSFANTATVSTVSTFIDWTAHVAAGGEMGLLGMAFHPDYASNGQIYIYYTADTPRRSVISRLVNANGQWQEQVILEVGQPQTNHNGGNIVFGPDGYLYIGLGDGGGGGDPSGNGQNTTSLLGSLLRIDVDATAPYTIPSDNPFAGNALCNDSAVDFNTHNCPEIYAWGLRNPWRWSFDRSSGALWLGDVGQGLIEEVDIIEKGKNYGWNIMEGDQCYNATTCNQTGLTLPVAVYTHAVGQAIVGGYVYRGQDARLQTILPATYLYADTYSTRIWGLTRNGAMYTASPLLDASVQYIYSFAEDNQGELYVLAPDFGSSAPGSNIYKIVAP